MRFEVMSGTEGLGTGGIRLCVPRKSGESLEDSIDSPVFMVPFRHVEQFIIIDEPSSDKSTPPTEKAYRVIIVPTAAVGASALKRAYPKVISFTLPNQEAGSDFQGKAGEHVDDPSETYRSLVTRVFNAQLAPFHKSVVDVSSAAAAPGDADARLVCHAVLKQDNSPPDKPANGQLFFLETGILFHSHTTVLYLTAESTPATMLVSNYEVLSKQPGPVNLSLVCQTGEPYYEKVPEKQQSALEQQKSAQPQLISFSGISTDMFDGITRYAKRHSIKLQDLEQDWYDLKQDQPATGWMPRGMFPRS
ncbi:hypothetical protein FJTKL_00455 [Diaporthe vaccinii]|uniref:Uncharacterized protein n=1 Tax=Diaporthe vaccinii TaxID=105482 RepID=A0ABR4E300_9PEZI